ncbi:MAG: hypothetical protein JWO62_1064 [Acidimicrobiaceae bacterium]|nr:hypothetical protein [Acidimicrobiaceae bacterium]
MNESSSTSLARKLGIAPGARLNLVWAPPGWHVPDLPDGVVVARLGDPQELEGDGHATRDDVTVAFYRSAGDLESGIEQLAPKIFPDGALWVAWPRRAGGHSSDITDNTVRGAALRHGLVDNKVAAIDQDWSGLRVVWRRERRIAR